LRTDYAKLIDMERVKSVVPELNGIAHEFTKCLEEVRDENGYVVDSLHQFTRYTMEATCFIAMGIRTQCLASDYQFDSDAQKFIQATTDSMNNLSKLFYRPGLWKIHERLSPAYMKVKKANQTQVRLIAKMYEEVERKFRENSKDIPKHLGLKMDVKKKNELLVIISDIVGASIDNTAVAIMSALILLAKHPTYQDRIYKEILQAKEPFELQMFPLTRACFKEVLRLRPIFDSLVRMVSKNMVLSGYQIPEGSIVFVPQREIGQDSRYVVNPNEFIPERWDKNEKDRRIPPLTSLPFGLGKRMCFGAKMADYEVILALVHIIKRFKVQFEDKEPVYRGYSLLLPDKPVTIRFIDRK